MHFSSGEKVQQFIQKELSVSLLSPAPLSVLCRIRRGQQQKKSGDSKCILRKDGLTWDTGFSKTLFFFLFAMGIYLQIILPHRTS